MNDAITWISMCRVYRASTALKINRYKVEKAGGVIMDVRRTHIEASSVDGLKLRPHWVKNQLKNDRNYVTERIFNI